VNRIKITKARLAFCTTATLLIFSLPLATNETKNSAVIILRGSFCVCVCVNLGASADENEKLKQEEKRELAPK
jgi:hypothetical protein